MKSAFDLLGQLQGRSLALFLDYDGTLTPIVAHPEEALLSPSMRTLIGALARHYPLAIISGRGLETLKALVGLEEIYYAGSHGLEIAGPAGLKHVIPSEEGGLDELERGLRQILSRFPGSQLERKRFSIAVHYRNVEKSIQDELRAQVMRVQGGWKALFGKRVLEFGPALAWDKGRAVLWLLEHFGRENCFPLYLGDDLTDEDAFRVLKGRGVGIFIGRNFQSSTATYRLESVDEVHHFLEQLLEMSR